MRETILSLLPPSHPWRDRVFYFDRIDSTNTRAKALAEAGAAHGAVVIAGEQTGGRGRMGRSFHSPAGAGLYLSVILRPNCHPGELMHLTCGAAVAACEAVAEASGVHPGVKWPNDLVAQGRKLAGILTELSLEPEGNAVRWAVIGIGVNCLQRDFPPELRDTAVSLAMLTGRDIGREPLAAAMIKAFSRLAETVLSQKDAIMASYRSRCVTLGQQVVLLPGKDTGKALDVDENGALIVEKTGGGVIAVTSGEVSIRKKDGYA